VPLYEFYCEPCDGIFEALRSMREAGEPAPCPVCNREAKRIMPTSFNAFTFREGYPRRIPDKGTYWHLGKEVKNPITGPVRPNEHPEINKPIPKPRPLKGDLEVQRERARMEAQQKFEAERERQAAIKAYEAAQAKKSKTADTV
jgi:putative FmdB family regulatory protein